MDCEGCCEHRLVSAPRTLRAVVELGDRVRQAGDRVMICTLCGRLVVVPVAVENQEV